MSHAANTRAFSRRMGRGFWSRAKRFSESAKPATGRLASDGTTGADSGSDSGKRDALLASTGALPGGSMEITGVNGSVGRGVAATDAPHVATLKGVETAGATPLTDGGKQVIGRSNSDAFKCGSAADRKAAFHSGASVKKGGDTDSIQNQQRPSPPSTHSAGGGVCCVMLAQVHYDRWATLAVIAVFICAFAVAAIRANRSSRPTTPPRGHSGGSASRNNRS